MRETSRRREYTHRGRALCAQVACGGMLQAGARAGRRPGRGLGGLGQCDGAPGVLCAAVLWFQEPGLELDVAAAAAGHDAGLQGMG